MWDTAVLKDEAIFTFCGWVNQHNVYTQGTENSYVSVESVRDPHNMNILCALSWEKVQEPFFFVEKTVT
jgi:hypothetical protein